MGLPRILSKIAGDHLVIVLINAISIKEGGSLLVLKRLLSGLIKFRPGITLHVVVNTKVARLPEFQRDNIKLWSYSWAEKSVVHLLVCYNISMPRLASKVKAHIFFSLTNYLPFKLKIPTLLLVQHAGHFSPDFERLYLKTYGGIFSKLSWRYKKRWVKRSIERASLVTVQKKTLADDIRRIMQMGNKEIKVIPHGLGQCSLSHPKKFPRNGKIRIGYITKFGVQKNFEVLFRAVSELLKEGRDVELVLTLDENIMECKNILNKVCAIGLARHIVNYGEIKEEEIEKLYDSLHIFVFPSLCESFGFPMIEAMSRGLPLLAADVPGNRDVAGEEGTFFGVDDNDNLAGQIIKLMANEKAYESASSYSIKRVQSFSWDIASTKTLELFDSLTHGI